jgi:uncharacterized membrane protein
LLSPTIYQQQLILQENTMNSITILPWLRRRSRLLLAAIATLGLIETTHLTIAKFRGVSLACPTNGCDRVLNSPYAYLFGVPLSLIGMTTYAAILVLAIAPLVVSRYRAKKWQQLADITWQLLFVGTTGMAIFSSYMMYVMAWKVQALCVYCLGSAILAMSLFTITLLGHRWDRWRRLLLIGTSIALVVLLGSLVVHADVERVAQSPANTSILEPQGEPVLGVGWEVKAISGTAELQLARHLQQIGAKEYSAWWCPHCHEQKELFGKNAYAELPNIECDSAGKKAQPAVCDAAKVQGFPTWDIKGKRLIGPQSLQTLAKASGYNGLQDFRNKLPQ